MHVLYCSRWALMERHTFHNPYDVWIKAKSPNFIWIMCAPFEIHHMLIIKVEAVLQVMFWVRMLKFEEISPIFLRDNHKSCKAVQSCYCCSWYFGQLISVTKQEFYFFTILGCNSVFVSCVENLYVAWPCYSSKPTSDCAGTLISVVTSYKTFVQCRSDNT